MKLEKSGGSYGYMYVKKGKVRNGLTKKRHIKTKDIKIRE